MDIEGIYRVVQGESPGKNLLILAGVHGNETCGIKAIERVVPALTIEQGTVAFILGNPRAIEKGARFTEANLNRMFRPDAELPEDARGTYEYRRSRELMPYIEAADAVLDIHSSGTKDTEPFAICSEAGLTQVAALNFPLVSYGWDRIEAGGTDDYAERMGARAFCIECGHHDDPEAIDRAEDAIYRFLAEFGTTSASREEAQKPQQVLRMTHAYKARTDFAPVRYFRDFDQVRSGETIGTDGGVPICAPEDGVVVFVRARQTAGQEAFVFGNTES